MSYCLQKRGSGPYHFRIRVPQDVQEWFDTPEIKRSLRTKNPSIAKSQCRLMTFRAEHVFSQIRSCLLSEAQTHQLIEKHFPSRKRMPGKAERPKTLAEVKDAYLREHVVLDKWTDKTKLEVDSALSIALEIIGNRSLKSISRQVAVDYLSKLKRLPANMRKRKKYRNLSIVEILDLGAIEPMSSRSVNKYVGRVSSLFIWCMRQEYMKWNPAEGLAVSIEVKEEEERKAYTSDDLKKLIPSLGKLKIAAPERYFVPLVARCSGMRLNEICQLYVSDVELIDGVWCFDINDDGDKRLKNKASRRVIPVHPELVRLGLLEHVERMRAEGNPRLWMNLKCKRDGYSHDFSKWYQRFNRKHITQDPKKVFHSFRHTVADTLKKKGVAEGVIAEILGHANQSITMGRYGKRFRPSVLLEALEQLDYRT